MNIGSLWNIHETTELGGSDVTSHSALGTSDAIFTTSLFSPHLPVQLKRNFFLPMDSNLWGSFVRYLLNAECQARKKVLGYHFLKSTWDDSNSIRVKWATSQTHNRCSNHYGTEFDITTA